MTSPAETAARRLRVCLVTGHVPPYDRIGGVERYTYDLARGLAELGHDVHLVAWHEVPVRPDGAGLVIHGIAPADLDERVGVSRAPGVTASARFAVAVARRIAALQRADGPFDVVHASNWNATGVAVLRARLAPLVLTLVTPLREIVRAQGRALDDDLRHALALDRWQIEHADAVCCPSSGALTAYEETVTRRPSVFRTPLGIALDAAPPRPGAASAPRLLFVGRLEPRKGIHVLLDALPRLLERHPDWYCDVVGDDTVLVPGTGVTYRVRFEAAHASAAWRDRVRFHGAVPDDSLRRFYASCDVFVAPSLFESFGLIYAEAMQYGKPVVGCRAGGVPEVVDDGVTGLLVRPDDVDALVAALDRLMGDRALRAMLGAAGRERVRTTLDHRAMAGRFADVYAQVAAAWRPDATDASEGVLARLLATMAARVAEDVPGGVAAVPINRARELVLGFRRAPIGGRLLALKRVVHWFVASAFDRQAKVHEALLAALVDLEQDVADLRAEQAETEGVIFSTVGFESNAAHSGPATGEGRDAIR